MKRDITYPIVKKFKPLIFWYKCRFCKREFRREVGFKIIDTSICREINDVPTYESYCCNECAKDEKEVKDLAKTDYTEISEWYIPFR